MNIQSRYKVGLKAVMGMMALLLFTGCEMQVLPEPSTDQVEYELKGELDGNTWEKAAGVDATYAFTQFELGQDNVYTFMGRMAPEDCKECGEWIEIRVRDIRLNPSEPPNLSEVFQAGMRRYFNNGGGEINKRSEVSLIPSSQDSTWQYNWTFDDGSSSDSVSVSRIYNLDEKIETEICLETIDSDGCKTLICNSVSLIDTGLVVDFTYDLVPGSNYIEFRSLSSGRAPFTYSWDFGDGFTSTLSNPGYVFATSGLADVCLTVTDFDGTTQTLCKPVASDPSLCDNGFTYKVANASTPDQNQYGSVEIRYHDEEGNLYSSARSTQDLDASFEIIASKMGLPNERAENVFALDLRFSAQLWDANEKRLELKDVIGRFPVGIPY